MPKKAYRNRGRTSAGTSAAAEGKCLNKPPVFELHNSTFATSICSLINLSHLHSYHFYVEQGVPQTQVLLWVYGERLRAVLDNAVLAEYHCRYDWRKQRVTDIRDGVFYPTRFASPQGALIPLTPQESLIVYRPKSIGRLGQRSAPGQQLWLFELVKTV